MGKVGGEHGLTLIAQPGPETSSSGDEEGHEFVVSVSSFDLTELGIELGPGEAVGENACVFSLDTVKVLRIVTVASRIDVGSVSAAFSGVSITVEVEILDLGNESVYVVEVEAETTEAA